MGTIKIISSYVSKGPFQSLSFQDLGLPYRPMHFSIPSVLRYFLTANQSALPAVQFDFHIQKGAKQIGIIFVLNLFAKYRKMTCKNSTVGC